MRWIVKLSLFLLTANLQAAPSTQVAWTKTTLALVESGDPQRGQALAKNCASCHGETGISVNPAFPSLAGQLATYLYRQLHDYQDGSRQNPLMQGFAAGLSEQDMADLAAFYSRQELAKPKGKREASQAVASLINSGDSKRILPPCRVCHGEQGQGERIDTPRLAGQSQDYLEQTLKAYRDGSRHNDLYRRMREIAEQLSDEEIRQLAAYYATLR
jgi:cytochrome c553